MFSNHIFKKKIVSLCLAVGLISLSTLIHAQTKKTNLPAAPKTKATTVQSESKQESKPLTQEEIDRNREIDAKIEEIEKAGYSPEEKEKMKDELYIATGRKMPSKVNSGFANINFKPRYLPTALLDKYNEMLKETGNNRMQNIVILNNALSLDFNKYSNRDLENKLDELSRTFKVGEKDAILYLLPQLTNEKSLKMNGGNVDNAIKLFFAYQPELYNLIPNSLLDKLKSPSGLNEVIEFQRKYSER